MSVQHNYLRDTQTEGGTGGSNPGGIWDLSTTQGTSAAMGSGNTQSTSFILAARFQRTVDDSVSGTSFPISINMASVSASTMEWRAKVQRVNSSNVVQAESDILGPFNTAGIQTGTLTLSTTWAAGDRLAVAIEYRKVSGGGNRSFSLNVNDADTFVDPDITVALTPTRGRLSFTELESPLVATRGRVSFAAFESPLVATRGRLSQAEFEAPTTATRGRTSWLEFEAPSIGPDPTRGRISWLELQTDFVGTRGRASWAEFEAPSAITPTRGRASVASLEVPLATTRGRLSFAVFQVPSIGGSSPARRGMRSRGRGRARIWWLITAASLVGRHTWL